FGIGGQGTWRLFFLLFWPMGESRPRQRKQVGRQAGRHTFFYGRMDSRNMAREERGAMQKNARAPVFRWAGRWLFASGSGGDVDSRFRRGWDSRE
ncbi:hypothetical protein QBC39DRAFT_343432, partial [Podospora conica]